jgi:hypothetical protein
LSLNCLPPKGNAVKNPQHLVRALVRAPPEQR